MFVPVSSQASPAAMELALRITNVIREYQQERSDVSGRDIRHALRMAELSTGSAPPKALVLAVVTALLAGGLALALLIPKGTGTVGGPTATIFPFMILMIVCAVFLVLVILRRR